MNKKCVMMCPKIVQRSYVIEIRTGSQFFNQIFLLLKISKKTNSKNNHDWYVQKG